MTLLSRVLCWKCQLTCRFFRFVVNIEEMRYSLPGHHCRSSQTLPCTTDPKCPAPPSPADLLVHSKAGISVLVIPSAHGQSRYVAGIVIQHLVHCLLVAPHRAAAVFPIPYAAFQYRKDGCPVIVVF